MTLEQRRGGGPKQVHYPQTDGKPMAETDQHRDEMLRLITTLRDVFVVLGVPGHPRPIYKLWEEGVPPTFVVEVTSPSTRREDQARKRTVYARLGVAEYVMYDPLGEYLRPPLQGYQLVEGDYRAMPEDGEGRLVSEALGLRLTLRDGRLQLFDAISGKQLLSPPERAEAGVRRADKAERRVAELETLLRAREGNR